MAASKSSLSAGYIIRQALLESEAVTAITSNVFPVVTDEAELPYIFYRRASMSVDPVKAGRGADTVEIDVLCCADDYDTSLELAEAVREALDATQGQAEGLTMRSCLLVDSQETWQDDAYIQGLTFNIKIS